MRFFSVLAALSSVLSMALTPLAGAAETTSASSSSSYEAYQQAKSVRQRENTTALFDVGEAKLRLGTGVDYSTGGYGQANDTEIWYVPFTGTLELDRWTAQVTVPYLNITGPGVVLGAADSSVTTDAPRRVTTG